MDNFGLVAPRELVSDFASDPLSQYDKVLSRADDSSWHLYASLIRLINDVPSEAIQWTFRDVMFNGLYGHDERLARIWFVDRLLLHEVSRLRLEQLLTESASRPPLPYSAAELKDLEVDQERMVRLSEFSYRGSSIQRGDFGFTTCLINQNYNSSYWLQQAFYARGLSDRMHIRLDPFLWGRKESFRQMEFRMQVYATPMDWQKIASLKEMSHGQMRPEKSWDKTELSEFCWTPRDDGIHFVCEELPRRDLVDVQAARYLHAIYDPISSKIIHFDGALRVYTAQQLEARLKEHVRKAGKAGTRLKIFRTDEPIDQDSFSLIAQSFFVWNEDVTNYLRGL